jgi:hypothetical protein
MKNKFKVKFKNYPKLYSILRKIYFTKEHIKFSLIYIFSMVFLILPIKKTKL